MDALAWQLAVLLCFRGGEKKETRYHFIFNDNSRKRVVEFRLRGSTIFLCCYSQERRRYKCFDFFYGQQANLFAFYRIPKVMFTDPAFRSLSTDAIVLYGILLDRMCLSAKNGWVDRENRVYIVYPIKKIMESLSCGNKKACQLLSELEKLGLIEKKRQGQGKPSRIYVKNFVITRD